MRSLHGPRTPTDDSDQPPRSTVSSRCRSSARSCCSSGSNDPASRGPAPKTIFGRPRGASTISARLAPDVESTDVIHEFFQQSNETDWDFLWRLATRVGYEVACIDEKIHFRAPGSDAGAPQRLSWGRNLKAFHQRATGISRLHDRTGRLVAQRVQGQIRRAPAGVRNADIKRCRHRVIPHVGRVVAGRTRAADTGQAEGIV